MVRNERGRGGWNERHEKTEEDDFSSSLDEVHTYHTSKVMIL